MSMIAILVLFVSLLLLLLRLLSPLEISNFIIIQEDKNKTYTKKDKLNFVKD